jgi:hypothetical protein
MSDRMQSSEQSSHRRSAHAVTTRGATGPRRLNGRPSELSALDRQLAHDSVVFWSTHQRPRRRVLV